jgi:energy-coupling factor transporter ATP-binding protein EcfA2
LNACILRTLVHLDEPTTGLDPRSRSDLWDVLRGLVEQGTTLLLTTQYLEEADQLADNIVVVDKAASSPRRPPTAWPTWSGSRAGCATAISTSMTSGCPDQASTTCSCRSPAIAPKKR